MEDPVRKVIMEESLKKLRSVDSSSNNTISDAHSPTFTLLHLPPELLCHVLEALDAKSLAVIATVCKRFREHDSKTLLRITDKAARDRVQSLRGKALSGRWWNYTWPQRLLFEDADAAFDVERCTQQNFEFQPDPSNTRFVSIGLRGMGPKLLVSKECTSDRPALRWHMRVTGNTAVEFGVIPVGLEDEQRALHKCMTVVPTVEERPVGFCSNITTGSQQVMRIPVFKGSEVEMVAVRGQVQFIITQPPTDPNAASKHPDGKEVPSRPPSEIRFSHSFAPDWPVKLAATTWAHGKYDVLHTALIDPPPRPTQSVATQTSPRAEDEA